MSTLRRGLAATLALAAAAGCAVLVWTSDGLRPLRTDPGRARPANAAPLAVLGDSDSHSYQDRVSFPPGSGKRGGGHHAATLQWTEVLARLRPQQVDPGEWGVWGVSRLVARAQDTLGLTSRAPRKEDFRFNFAISGAGCETLTTGGGRQAQRLVSLMDREPQRWRAGVVVIRIGMNSFGMDDGLEQFAKDPDGENIRREVARCIAQVRAAVDLVHAHQPEMRIVLVGIYDNTNWPRYFERWQSGDELANVARGLDVYDKALAQMAATDSRLAFFDDRAWFARRWGSRDSRGRPAYRPVTLASGLTVHNTIGDEPIHAVIGDGHAGLVWNVLWAQSLIDLLNLRFDMQIPPVGEDEAARFVDATLTSNR